MKLKAKGILAIAAVWTWFGLFVALVQLGHGDAAVRVFLAPYIACAIYLVSRLAYLIVTN